MFLISFEINHQQKITYIETDSRILINACAQLTLLNNDKNSDSPILSLMFDLSLLTFEMLQRHGENYAKT